VSTLHTPPQSGAPPTDDLQWTPAPAPPRRSTPVAWALALIAIGVLWLLQIAGVDIRWEFALPIALVVLGAAMIALSFTGGHPGLVALGIVLTLLAIVGAVVEGPIAFGIGERVYEPTDVTEIDDGYAHGMGSMTVDLRGIALPEGTTDLDVHVTMGELRIVAPDDVTVVLDGRAVAGEVEAFGRSQSGIDAHLVAREGDSDRVLLVDASVVFGRIEVTP
jgi:hypothetical protein